MRILRGLLFLILASVAVFAQVKPTQISTPSDVAAPPADAIKSKNGLESKVLKPGTGTAHPGKDDIVTIDYSAWSSDGKLFDGSVVRGHPSEMALKNMLPGLAEGIELMQVGETSRLWIPEKLAFKGREGKPKGTVVFDVTLLEIPTHAPDDVKAPPADAEKSPSGLAYQVLRPGTGTHHPTSADTVTVHYTGWTTDGKMFDSSLTRGAPSTLPMDKVIVGWTEGLNLMVEGEKMRLWIPERLAYKGESPPFGMLVFDIELLKIQ